MIKHILWSGIWVEADKRFLQYQSSVPENAFGHTYERERERAHLGAHTREREREHLGAYTREREISTDRPCDMMSPLQLFKTQHTWQTEMF